MDNSLYSVYAGAIPVMLQGCLMTAGISAAGIIGGVVTGSLFGIFECDKLKNRWLSPLIRIYIAVFRGTPLFVQLLLVYFALPSAFNFELSPISAGILTLWLNSTAYLGEIFRAGINSVALGQWEASYFLGYSRFKTFRYIILPQAIRNVLPAITNEFTTLVKESSILMVIGVPELIKVSKDIVARNLMPMEIYLLAAGFYFAMTFLISLSVRKLEKRLAV